jgi:hypothetical protein
VQYALPGKCHLTDWSNHRKGKWARGVFEWLETISLQVSPDSDVPPHQDSEGRRERTNQTTPPRFCSHVPHATPSICTTFVFCEQATPLGPLSCLAGCRAEMTLKSSGDVRLFAHVAPRCWLPCEAKAALHRGFLHNLTSPYLTLRASSASFRSRLFLTGTQPSSLPFPSLAIFSSPREYRDEFAGAWPRLMM